MTTATTKKPDAPASKPAYSAVEMRAAIEAVTGPIPERELEQESPKEPPPPPNRRQRRRMRFGKAFADVSRVAAVVEKRRKANKAAAQSRRKNRR
jgi:hypothetical protein